MNSVTKRIGSIHYRLDKIALKGKDNYLEFSDYFNDLTNNGDYNNLLQCLYLYYSSDVDNIKNYETFKKSVWKEILFKTDSNINKRIKKMFDKKQVYQTGFDIYSSDTNFSTTTLSSPLSVTYSITNLPKGISINYSNKVFNLSRTNSHIYDVIISKALWVSNSPTEIEEYQKVIGLTDSTYNLEIPSTHDTQWLVTTYERSNYKILNYKLDVLTTNKYLGRILEKDIYSDEVKYLIKNKEYARITKTRKTFLEVEKFGATQSVPIEQNDLNLSEENNLYNRYMLAINLLLL